MLVNTKFLTLFLLLCIVFSVSFAKSKPNTSQIRIIAFKRAKSLDNGISISGFEQTWDKDILDNEVLNSTDLVLLKRLGFKSIRLPVAFRYFNNRGITYQHVFTRIDKVVKLCKLYGFKVVIDYHDGNLNDTNYLTETPEITKFWLQAVKRYSRESPDDLFFELYNEPPHMNPQIWKDAVYNMVTAIRKIDKTRTLIIGASNFNSIYELSRFERLPDENIIYTFHFYEPFFFTHQGAEWIGAQSATTGVSFPYSAENFPELNPKAKTTWGETNYNQYKTDGNEQSVKDKLLIVKKWGEKYDVPIICGEYGVYNKYTDQASRCRYIKAVRQTLKAYGIPGMLWDYNANFSIFNGKPSVQNLPDCMKEAIGYVPKK